RRRSAVPQGHHVRACDRGALRAPADGRCDPRPAAALARTGHAQVRHGLRRDRGQPAGAALRGRRGAARSPGRARRDAEVGAVTDAHPEDGAPAQVTVPGDSVLPGTADAKGWRRLHPLSPLLRGGLVLLVIAGIVIANFRDRLVELFFADRVWSRDGVEVDLSQEGGDIVDLFEYLVEQGLLLL